MCGKGRYGGYESFDIEHAREAVLQVARSAGHGVGSNGGEGGGGLNSGGSSGSCGSGGRGGVGDIYFLMMNTPPLSEGDEARIVHVPKTSSDEAKSRFIRTCDAMLHARSSGETFGLSVGEFSAHNRPVITSREHTDHGTARFHLDTLGSKGLFYSSKDELVGILTSFDRAAYRRKDNNAYRAFEPASVMKTFERVFLKEKARRTLPEWKRWGHQAGGGSSARRGGATSARRAEAEAEWRRQWELQDALGKLRGLPAAPEVASGTPPPVYCVVSGKTKADPDGVRVRLAPSVSAAAVGPPLAVGARITALASRGAWVRIQAEAQQRWVLTRHPEHGSILQLT